ncbi:acyl-CoA thioester hydrolase/BAAT C-terminal domain-containing protein [Leucobacter sp. UT-8R-CII-1-4]|uniref:acyl-CoA thioester hydrolase/BAAT C-terminal domain-containing protein n=1 Tax=Leucobacter sp. UT-8R-CII-1-4 TaxID=3040075 RepID=UPI0024A9687C|nr:acyl-CoA thioester hydrolase/BAAT C-terminal domain-containing protein [Leucobacter sp. UT-8R-CII-1-4]MDI6023863.1 acyl-CoA thioester hydrolase/BAAT C-terminal domain-containing protein [Leucobacter sp. UT-8R-CII-1-4]
MTSDRALKITVTPSDAELWQRRSIQVSGATPGAVVTVTSSTLRDGVVWSSQASFLSGLDGAVNLDTEAPVSGRYRNADAMGLIWSQRAEGGGRARPEPSSVAEPLVTKLEAWSEPGTGDYAQPGPGAVTERGEAELIQRLHPGGVERVEVTEDGLVGTVFVPEGEGPFPTIIVMNGSGGGVNELRAAQYASRGIQAFALGYFRVPGRSDFISRTPIEYFETAIDYAARELNPLGGKPLVSGQSRGGELTLLLASRFPEKIAGIVAFVPGAFTFGAQGAADPAEGWSGPTWTWQDEPLEHLWHNNSGVYWQPWDGEMPTYPDQDIYIDGLHDRELAKASLIPIERFSGPVACVSGLDDRAWPSSMASRMALGALERAGHTAERLHLDYEAAGHGIAVPFLPSTNIEVKHPVSGAPYSNGGTPLGNARASEQSFEEVVAFVRRSAVGS